MLRHPSRKVASGATPRATDSLPVHLTGGTPVAQVLQPVHVWPQLPDVAHSIRIGRGRYHAGVPVGRKVAGQFARIAEVDIGLPLDS